MSKTRNHLDKDLIGMKFGLWTLIKPLKSKARPDGRGSRRMYRAKCDCGTVKDIHLEGVVRGASKSCGCKRRDLARAKNFKHGFANRGKKTKLYNLWVSMKFRCHNKNSHDYHLYGQRGIRVCKKWRNDFTSFQTWATANGYREGLQLDRINNEGNYQPSNCRFTTCQVNCSNRRSNVMVSIDGVVSTLTQAARNIGKSSTAVRTMLRKGGALSLRH